MSKNLIFLTMSNLQGIAGRGIYIDLMRKSTTDEFILHVHSQ